MGSNCILRISQDSRRIYHARYCPFPWPCDAASRCAVKGSWPKMDARCSQSESGSGAIWRGEIRVAEVVVSMCVHRVGDAGHVNNRLGNCCILFEIQFQFYGFVVLDLIGLLSHACGGIKATFCVVTNLDIPSRRLIVFSFTDMIAIFSQQGPSWWFLKDGWLIDS